jgi:EspG family
VPDPAIVAARRVLSAVEFDVVWETLGLGPVPVVLNVPSPGRTHTERRRIVAEVRARLQDRGLTGPTGPEPGLGDLLRLLATPTARIELRAWGPALIRATAAGHPEEGVLARCSGDSIVLEPCVSVASAIVSVLPPAPAGPGRAANVPTATLRAAIERPSGAGLRADLLRCGVPVTDAGPAARMLHGIGGRAQFGVVAADRWGVLRRSPATLGVLDGVHGRYVVIRTRNDGDWTTVAPVDDRRLRHRVTELLTCAVGQSRSPWRMSCRPDSVIEPDSEG